MPIHKSNHLVTVIAVMLLSLVLHGLVLDWAKLRLLSFNRNASLRDQPVEVGLIAPPAAPPPAAEPAPSAEPPPPPAPNARPGRAHRVAPRAVRRARPPAPRASDAPSIAAPALPAVAPIAPEALADPDNPFQTPDMLEAAPAGTPPDSVAGVPAEAASAVAGQDSGDRGAAGTAAKSAADATAAAGAGANPGVNGAANPGAATAVAAVPAVPPPPSAPLADRHFDLPLQLPSDQSVLNFDAYLERRSGDQRLATAALELRHDDKSYHVTLQASLPLVSLVYTSIGSVGPDGFLPEQFMEVRKLPFRDPRTQQVRFIPVGVEPPPADGMLRVTVAPGTQDRVSVMLQLWAIARTYPERVQPGREISIAMASFGGVSLSVFKVQAQETIEVGGRMIYALHIVRVEEAGSTQGIEVWLSDDDQKAPVAMRYVEGDRAFKFVRTK